jgi:hypothetical protein
MKKQIDSILIINKYLVSHKDNKTKSMIARDFLKEKLNRALKSKNPTFSLEVFNLPLHLFSF